MSLTLVEVCTTFSADDRCRELLERLRWPEGPLCLRCGGIEVARLSVKLLFCRKCDGGCYTSYLHREGVIVIDTGQFIYRICRDCLQDVLRQVGLKP